MANTKVKVRVQARGGKFLGPNVTAPTLLVRIAGSTAPLFTGPFDNSASGTVVATPDARASRNAIVVQRSPSSELYPAAGAYWLEPPARGAELIASFDLPSAAVVEFIATAYTPKPVIPLSASAMMPLFPGMQLLADPGLVLTFPGLLASNLTASYANGRVTVSAKVEMMCGCPITPQPWTTPQAPETEPYWPSYAFNVTAYVAGQSFALQCTSTNTFSGSQAIPLPPGNYEVDVVAEQPAETNVGLAIGQLTV